jgi:hypothetical protein
MHSRLCSGVVFHLWVFANSEVIGLKQELTQSNMNSANLITPHGGYRELNLFSMLNWSATLP